MAYFWEDEEEVVEAPTRSFSGEGVERGAVGGRSFGRPSAFDVGEANFKGAYGNFLDKYAPHMFGDAVPEEVRKYGAQMDADAELVRSQYVSEYAQYNNDITQVPWEDVPGFVSEKVQENGYLMSLQAGGAWLAGKLRSSPDNRIKAVGTVLGVITVAAPTPVIIDEVVNKHAEELGIPVSQMTDAQITNGIIGGLENTALEALVPVGLMKGVNLPDVKTGKDLFKHLTNTQKHTFATQLMNGLKYGGKNALSEGATEMLQTINAQRTSVTGLGGLDRGEVITSGVVGTAAGGPMSAPSAISQSRSYNKFRKQGADWLNQKDRSSKLQSAVDYEQGYQDLLKSYVGPADDTGAVSLDRDTATPEVTPELYNLPAEPKGTLGNLGDFVADKLLNRSTNEFQSMFDKAKTGSDVDLIRRQLFGSFGEVESGSGDTQMGNSFNSKKHTYLGKFTTEFNDIKSKWSSHYVGMGEFGAGVRPVLNKYVRLILEGKSAEAQQFRGSLKLNGKKLKELDADIAKIRKIQDNVWKDLNESIKGSGLEVGYTKDYVTRGIDTAAMQKDKEGFIKSLAEDVEVYPKGMKKEDATPEDFLREAERIYDDILNGKDPSIMSSEQIRAAVQKRTGAVKPSFEEHRDMRWDSLAQKFRKDDVFSSIQDYLTRAATRAASSDVFGGRRAEKLSASINKALERGLMDNEQAQSIWDMYDAEHNIYKRPKDDKQRAFQSFSKVATTATAISYLGLAPISSITEPAWISGRVGTANMLKALPTVAAHILIGMKSSFYGGKTGTKTTKSFGKELLNVLGMAINPQINERIDKLMAGDSNKVLTMFFRSPGGLFLTQYTNFVRVWTAAAGLKMIQNQANKLSGMKGHKLSALKRELTENGMSIDDFKLMIRAGNGKIDILNDEFLNKRIDKTNGTNVSIRDLLVPWLRKITTDVALEPTVGNRPLWMSDPRMQMLSQLKSFPILFGNTIMKRTHRQLVRNNQCSPGIVGALGGLGSAATALALGALAMAIKDEIRNKEDREYGPIDLVSATGVPWIGSGSLVQMSSIPALSVVDDFWSAFTDTDDTPIDMAKGMEHFLEFGTKATLGAIFSEGIKDDD